MLIRGGVPPVEAMWAEVLSTGKAMYGVASGDTHTIRRPGRTERDGCARAGIEW